MEPLLSLDRVGKAFGEHHVFRGLSWSVYPGEVVAVIGPNGAGKSTLLRIMAGFEPVTDGSVAYRGEDVTQKRVKLRQVVGYVADRPFMYPHLTAYEFLSFVAKVRGVASTRLEELVRTLALPSDSLIADLSYGTARKVAIAAGVMHQPPILLMDEPFNALDYLANRVLQDIISHLRSQGCTVVIATHYLPAIEKLYDRILLLRTGWNSVTIPRSSGPHSSLEDLMADWFSEGVTNAQ